MMKKVSCGTTVAQLGTQSRQLQRRCQQRLSGQAGGWRLIRGGGKAYKKAC